MICKYCQNEMDLLFKGFTPCLERKEWCSNCGTLYKYLTDGREVIKTWEQPKKLKYYNKEYLCQL